MPYASNEDLPPSVRSHLPPHAQDIFRAAFNNAFEEYGADPLGEEIAFRVAWAAVKKHYHKIGSEWVPKTDRGSL
ncbi:MAG: ChaB family protein [Alphaproteobacteria bacterium]|nr:ChaB family protein [Alphaproteobacteria bacterium]